MKITAQGPQGAAAVAPKPSISRHSRDMLRDFALGRPLTRAWMKRLRDEGLLTETRAGGAPQLRMTEIGALTLAECGN